MNDPTRKWKIEPIEIASPNARTNLQVKARMIHYFCPPFYITFPSHMGRVIIKVNLCH